MGKLTKTTKEQKQQDRERCVYDLNTEIQKVIDLLKFSEAFDEDQIQFFLNSLSNIRANFWRLERSFE